MSITWPGSLAYPAGCKFTADFPQRENSSPFDGSIEVNELHWVWRAMLTWGNHTAATEHALSALLGACRGAAVSIKVPLFHYQGQIGNAGGSYTAGAALADERTLNISGGSGSFAAGDYIEIGGHAYQINVGGSSTIQIVGGLRVDQGGGSVMRYLGDAAGTTMITDNMRLAGSMAESAAAFPSPADKIFGARAVEFESTTRT